LKKDGCLRILFLGDIVGRAGRRVVIEHLPVLRQQYELDFVIVNGENSSGGFGINERNANSLFEAGVDVITTGNHVWDQRETISYIAREPRLLRPANFPPGAPGQGAGMFQLASGASILVVNLMGRVFMKQLDCPFQAIARELEACHLGESVDAIFVDMHAEASSEKQAMGAFLDGRVSAVGVGRAARPRGTCLRRVAGERCWPRRGSAAGRPTLRGFRFGRARCGCAFPCVPGGPGSERGRVPACSSPASAS